MHRASRGGILPGVKRKYVTPEVVISSSQTAMRVPREKIRRFIALVTKAECAQIRQVDLAVVTTGQIAALNRRWLGHAGATDVISFDLSDDHLGAGMCAQLVVCGDVAVRQAHRRAHGPQRELLLYVVHGLLHLTGYDDTHPRNAARMHARQEELLDAFWRGERKR